ncbi:uncharacterized mitochondrial protein AtMg00310-like [Salvia miltiorrhiza]|uniref:uncharacterized mitochondrial protein AtMg00310-like n=1 Tax=Salvia miltiorrhiza TaxID=226208 RepID=UPI0025AC5D57|nr:uncharacterized mitochondrial protein AtMg00310-like [Salvia miltiorrhiza]
MRAGQRTTYLGIPSTVGQSKSEIFQMLVDRTRKKSKDWKRRFLLGAGKMVLIKAVLQSIPSYIMSCFALPDQVCQQLNSVAVRFFWGQKNDERRIHWKSWKKICVPKGEGCLGFRDIALFNQAMLAKQVWRLLTNDTSLLARSLKARYFPINDLLLASNAHNPSYAWKSLLVGRDLIVKGLALEVRKWGANRIGVDSWLLDGKGQFFTAKVDDGFANLTAQEMMNGDLDAWDCEKIEEILQPSDRQKVLFQIQPKPNEKDRPFWPWGKFNMYSVKSGYKLALDLK